MMGSLIGIAALLVGAVVLCLFVAIGGLGFIAALFEAIADVLFGGDS